MGLRKFQSMIPFLSFSPFSVLTAFCHTVDPLSLTASIIAIIGIGGQAAKLMSRLDSTKVAPDSVLVIKKSQIMEMDDTYSAVPQSVPPRHMNPRYIRLPGVAK